MQDEFGGLCKVGNNKLPEDGCNHILTDAQVNDVHRIQMKAIDIETNNAEQKADKIQVRVHLSIEESHFEWRGEQGQLVHVIQELIRDYPEPASQIERRNICPNGKTAKTFHAATVIDSQISKV